MSAMDDFGAIMSGRFIVVAVDPKNGVLPGQPATVKFDASGTKASVVTIHDSDGELLYEGSTRGSIVVAPTRPSWYVLTASGPNLHEEKVIEVPVREDAGGRTRSWSRVAPPGEAADTHAAAGRPAWARRWRDGDASIPKE